MAGLPLALRFLFARNPRVAFSTALGRASSPRVSPPLFGRIRKDVAEKDANCEYENRDGGVHPSGFVLYENEHVFFSLSLLRDLRFSSSYFSPSLSLSLFFFASLNIRSVEGVMTS